MDLELKAKLRPIAREKAAWFSNELDKVAQEKGNIHQARIDLADELDVFAASLPEEQREMFYSLHAEELEANAAEKIQKADDFLAEAEAIQSEYKFAGAVIGGVILFFVLLLVFAKFK